MLESYADHPDVREQPAEFPTSPGRRRRWRGLAIAGAVLLVAVVSRS